VDHLVSGIFGERTRCNFQLATREIGNPMPNIFVDFFFIIIYYFDFFIFGFIFFTFIAFTTKLKKN